MIDKRAKQALVGIGLLELVEKYFPDKEKWSIKYRKTRQRARRLTVAKIQLSRKTVIFYSQLFTGTFEQIKHTIIHEYAHWFLDSTDRPSGHTPEFYKILHILEDDENCLLTQNKTGLQNLTAK